MRSLRSPCTIQPVRGIVRIGLASAALALLVTESGCRALAGCDEASEGPAAVVSLRPDFGSGGSLLKHQTIDVTVPARGFGPVTSTHPRIVQQFQPPYTSSGNRTHFFVTQALGDADLTASNLKTAAVWRAHVSV